MISVGLLLTALGTSGHVGLLSTPRVTHAATGCQLSSPAGTVQHVIYIQFDNTHFMRDIARDGSTNVPSDLEQMPHLLNFIEGNGTLLSNHHTPLISHTSNDITTSETGVYPSRHGVATAENSYYYYDQTLTPRKTSGFSYWTSKIGDGQYNFTSAPNTNAPAPWVPFTRAGCNVGAVAMTGFALENTTTDLTTAFPAGAPASTNPFADFLGVAVHCAAGDPLCSSANGGVPDVLPNEPNPDGSAASAAGAGYQGFNALYGHKLLAGAISPDHTNLFDINGHPIVDDVQGSLSPGFPGFSLAPQYSLGYTADMQEHGVPVTFAYIITPHRPLPANPYGYGFPNDSRDYGPGEAGYVAQLHQFDDAFNSFFTRLNADGINKNNTLFVFTSEEGDHFIGATPSPAGCDGATVAGQTVTPDVYCTYSQLGELTTNYDGLMQGEQGANLPAPPATTVVVDNDDAPSIYLKNMPAPADPLTRAYERATGALTVVNPISQTLTLSSTERLTQALANPTEFQILHMLTADPLRTPTFIDFAQPDYYVEDATSVPTSLSGCATSPMPAAACVVETPGFNWNHGDVQPQISTTWVGFVGPGVLNRGLDGPDPSAEARGVRFGTFSDHTDIRPTMLALLGLRDDYRHDGRVVTEVLDPRVVPSWLERNQQFLSRLGDVYKQINAPVGALGLDTLKISTIALESTDDNTFATLESRLTDIAAERDTLVARLQPLLDWTEPGTPESAAPSQASALPSATQGLFGQAVSLRARVDALASQL
jgi:hypothetical protein